MHAFLRSIIRSFMFIHACITPFIHPLIHACIPRFNTLIHTFISRQAQRQLLLRGIWWMKRKWQSIIWVLTSTGGGSTVIQWKRPVCSVSRNRAGWLVVGPYDITMTSWWYMWLVAVWPPGQLRHTLRKCVRDHGAPEKNINVHQKD